MTHRITVVCTTVTPRSAISEHRVTIAELEGDVPADSLDDEQAIKVAAFEERWCVRGELGHATDYRHTSQFAPEPSRARP